VVIFSAYQAAQTPRRAVGGATLLLGARASRVALPLGRTGCGTALQPGAMWASRVTIH
jgi:hypothetical protein